MLNKVIKMKKMLLKTRKIFFLLLVVVITSLIGITCLGDNVWSDPEIMSFESAGFSYRASLAIGMNDTVHIAWKDKTDYNGSGDDWDVFYRYKPINGSWSLIEVVSTENTSECSCLSLTVDYNDTVHIVWAAKTDDINSLVDKIYYRCKTRNGIWGKVSCVSNESIHDCTCPSIGVDNKGIVYVAWPDRTNYNNSGDDYDIFYKYKAENGYWSALEVVSAESTSQSLAASIDIDRKDTIHVIWNDRTDFNDSGKDYDIVYKFKTKDGIWSDTEIISKESKSNCKWPSLTVDSKNKVHVAWADQTNYQNSGTDYDIFYKSKTENGHWSALEVVSAESTSDSNWPSFDIDSNGIVHMSWWDDTNGNWITYYKMRSSTEDNLDDNGQKLTDNTPGFEVIIAVFAILLFLYAKNKK